MTPREILGDIVSVANSIKQLIDTVQDNDANLEKLNKRAQSILSLVNRAEGKLNDPSVLEVLSSLRDWLRSANRFIKKYSLRKETIIGTVKNHWLAVKYQKAINDYCTNIFEETLILSALIGIGNEINSCNPSVTLVDSQICTTEESLRDNRFTLTLDLNFKHDLTQGEEESRFFKKLRKPLSIILCLLSGVFLGAYTFHIQKNKISSVLFATATMGIYGIWVSWLTLNILKEWDFFEHYPEEALEREELPFKILKHFLSLSLSIFPVLPTITSKEPLLAVLYSIVSYLTYVCGYYFLFDSKNIIAAFFSQEARKSVLRMNAATQMIDNVIPCSLKKTKEDRSKAFRSIYNSKMTGYIRLLTMLEEFQEETDKNFINKKSYTWLASIMLAGVFTAAYAVIAYGNTKAHYTKNSEAMAIVCTLTMIPPLFSLDLELMNQFFNQYLPKIFNREKSDFVGHFYKKTACSISITAYVFTGLLVTFGVMTQTIGYHDTHSSFRGNYFIDGLVYLQSLLVYPMVFEFVYKTLITSCFDIFGNLEQKDVIRFIDLLAHIKDNVFKKANPELVNNFCETLEHNKLLGLKEIEDDSSIKLSWCNLFPLNFRKASAETNITQALLQSKDVT